MNKYGEPTGKLSEGIYKIEEGYEYIGNYNGNIIIQKNPDFNEYDFVAFEDGWFGILKKYQYNNKAAFYVDFHLYKDSWGKYSVEFAEMLGGYGWMLDDYEKAFDYFLEQFLFLFDSTL